MTTTADDIDTIERAVQDFLAAIKVDDLDGMLGFYAPDAVIMPPDQAAMQGTEAIGAFRAVLDEFAVEDFVSFPEEVVVLGDWGFRRGAFAWYLRPRAGGDTVERRSKFLQVWQRQADGSWRVARGIWNADRPSTESE